MRIVDDESWLMINVLKILLFWTLSEATTTTTTTTTRTNRPPRFVAGGDMAQFSLPEDIAVGTTVYKLRGTDPDGGSVYYSISGEYFSVHKHSGDVILIKPLDRELVDTIEVIVSITDETPSPSPSPDSAAEEPNTVSLKREIPIIDVNDNRPTFNGSQYDFAVAENAEVGSVAFAGIAVSDIDFGLNSIVNVVCVRSTGCQFFSLSVDKIRDGVYAVALILRRSLNYELQSSYTLWLQAIDSNPKKPLSSVVKVVVDVEDVQDEPPIFFNAPYSIAVYENTEPGVKLLSIAAKDGDEKNLRPLAFHLREDVSHYFTVESDGLGNASIFTSHNLIDREHSAILQMGGIYSFYISATEVTSDDDDESIGNISSELVTVVIKDRDDHLPKFNQQLFLLNVSEDIGVGTPLPSLGMTVSDADIGDNARFSLTLKAHPGQFADCFSIEPATAVGKSAVIIRVVNNTGFDYENGIREITLYAVASVVDGENVSREAARAQIIVNVTDANDNAPKFQRSKYVVNVMENTPVGTSVAQINAIDRDSGLFSRITYTIGGFGTDKFDTDSNLGGLIVTNKIDYEQQTSFSLTVNAKDGGNRSTTVNVLVNIVDVNDNAPVFDFNEYRRNIREGSSTFQPQFFVKASDADGTPNNTITYSIFSANSNAVGIDETTGEILITQPASSKHTSRGQYELKVRATDSGEPALWSDTTVFIRVGVPGNQRPVFKGTPYNVTILETLPSDSMVTTVRATDPDGPDDSLEYKITGQGADQFYIKPESGVIFLADSCELKVNHAPSKRYGITVLAIDSGTPLRETAQTTVIVNVLNVNDEPPAFQHRSYVSHIFQRMINGTSVIKVRATDSDYDSLLEYSLLKPFQITDRRGFTMVDELGIYNDLFSIDKNSGDVKIQRALSEEFIRLITVTVQVRDTKATASTAAKQIDRAEITFFVETIDEIRPVFLIGGWMRSNPTIVCDLLEEQPIGSTVLRLIAQDPVTMSPIREYRAKTALPRQLAVDPVGNVVLTERVDYETVRSKILTFEVEAISDDDQRTTSEAKVFINIVDANDHSPQFSDKIYRGSIEENSKSGTTVLFVKATDGDLPTSPRGYGNITYHLAGEHAFLFDIDPKEGRLKVAKKATIDREKQLVLNVIAVATDTPSGGKERRKSEVPIQIDILDVNDNAPIFVEKDYSIVILENIAIGTGVLKVSAIDRDSGKAGIVSYEIINEFDCSGFFKINSVTGEIVVQRALAGRGRNYPYGLSVRAQDNGEPALFTDIHISVLIGDVLTNDGVPVFVHPTENEIAYISEDSPIGSLVFQVVAADADDPFTPEGQIQYSFLKDSSDADAFHIDPLTGRIITKVKLDRELKSKYSLILTIKDGGVVSQQSSRVLQIRVNDTDDNVPIFNRTVDEKPAQLSIMEELPVGTLIKTIEAFDPDENENAQVAFFIIGGNEENLLEVVDSTNNSAILRVAKRIDRENVSQISLTLKCHKKFEKLKISRKKYNKTDLSERQIDIKVLDIDDNYPEFVEENITVGVRFNVPINTLLLTLKAHDNDVETEEISYFIRECTFVRSNWKQEWRNSSFPFILNSSAGELRTNLSMTKHVDGHFIIEVIAVSGSSVKSASCFIKVYVVREKASLKFIFSKTPSQVKEYLVEFKNQLQRLLAMPSVRLDVYETHFYAKPDGNLDFSKTSSCIEVITDDYDAKEADFFLKLESNEELRKLYDKYSVQSVQRYANVSPNVKITGIQISLLGIAIFIAVASIISGYTLCCSYKRWQRLK
ncbi:cadherin-23 isoform X2 [Planococcus citri]|uniref:cadherin-23 isoform X2 n=1 Tax=Planococcus citri TaxID=170843 RepID=UPI0031F759DA